MQWALFCASPVIWLPEVLNLRALPVTSSPRLPVTPAGFWGIVVVAFTLGVLAGAAMVWQPSRGHWSKVKSLKSFVKGQRTVDLEQVAVAPSVGAGGEERLRLAIEAANDGIWDWDIKGGTVFGSDRAYQLLGMEPGAYEWNYKSISRLIHPQDRKHFTGSLRQHLRTGELFQVELRLHKADGNYRWFMVKGKAIRDATGKPTRIVGLLISVNYRKWTEEAEIRIGSVIEDTLWPNIEKLHPNRLLQNVLDTLPVGVWVADGTSRIIQANPAAKEIWCQTNSSFTPDLAKYKAWRAETGEAISPDEWTIAVAAARRETSPREILEIQCFNADCAAGSVHKTIICWAVPLSNAQGEVVGAIAVFWDMTESRQVEAALRRSEQELREERNFISTILDRVGALSNANATPVGGQDSTAQIQASLERERETSQLQRRFFSMVCHEFRTPLSTILMSAQILQNSNSQMRNPKAVRNLLRIEISVLRAIRLLDDIMTINQGETGRLQCQPRPINLGDFCRQVVEEIEMLGDGETKIDWAVKAENLPRPPIVFLDEKLLRSILCNLLSNALKYSPSGAKVEMLALVEPFQVVLRVRDTGMGIAPTDLSRLFEPFYRAEDALTRPGSGLGLTVVKKCVDLHRGTITVESQLGEGTTFTVTLPHLPSR